MYYKKITNPLALKNVSGLLFSFGVLANPFLGVGKALTKGGIAKNWAKPLRDQGERSSKIKPLQTKFAEVSLNIFFQKIKPFQLLQEHYPKQ